MVSSVAALCVRRTAHALLCVVMEDDSSVFRFLSLVMLTFELGRDFCTMHLTAEFHHPAFNRSEDIVLTNKQAKKKDRR